MCVHVCVLLPYFSLRYTKILQGRGAGEKNTHFQMEFKGGKKASGVVLSLSAAVFRGISNAGISTMQMSVWEPERSATASRRSRTAPCKRSGAKHSASEMDGAAYFRNNMRRKTVCVCVRVSWGGCRAGGWLVGEERGEERRGEEERLGGSSNGESTRGHNVPIRCKK